MKVALLLLGLVALAAAKGHHGKSHPKSKGSKSRGASGERFQDRRMGEGSMMDGEMGAWPEEHDGMHDGEAWPEPEGDMDGRGPGPMNDRPIPGMGRRSRVPDMGGDPMSDMTPGMRKKIGFIMSMKEQFEGVLEQRLFDSEGNFKKEEAGRALESLRTLVTNGAAFKLTSEMIMEQMDVNPEEVSSLNRDDINPELKSCLGGYRDKMNEMGAWMSAAAVNGMACKLETLQKAGMEEFLEAVENPRDQETRQCLKDMKLGMMSKIAMGIKMGKKVREGMVMATEYAGSSCRAPQGDAGQRLLSLLEEAPPMMKAKEKLASGGHMCKMAMGMKMMPAAFAKEVLSCFVARMDADGMPVKPEYLDAKEALFTAVRDGGLDAGMAAIPEQMAEWDRVLGAKCMLRNCDSGSLMDAVEMSGLEPMFKMFESMEHMGMAKAEEHCNCLRGAFPEAPFFADEDACNFQRAAETMGPRACAAAILEMINAMRDAL